MCRKKYTGDTITFNIFMLGEALRDLTPVTNTFHINSQKQLIRAPYSAANFSSMKSLTAHFYGSSHLIGVRGCTRLIVRVTTIHLFEELQNFNVISLLMPGEFLTTGPCYRPHTQYVCSHMYTSSQSSSLHRARN